ncbi:MAG TPA: AMP-binding protein [Acidimicrobiales bacterium]|nr:AMP-binding protein [Acidimicrobiales bacterium]
MTRPEARVEFLDPVAAEDAQRRAAGTLRRAGLRAGDRVAFCLRSSADLLNCVLGAARTGIVPVLLNATLLGAERDVLVADAEPAMVIDDEEDLARLLTGAPAELAPFPLTRPMHYTSGTTGRAKGVWSGVLTDEEARGLFEDEAELWGFDAGDTHLVCSPMYHSVAIRLASASLLRGGRLIVLSRFDAALAAQVLRQHRPTTTFMAPTALQRLLADPRTEERIDSLRLLIHAGSACPARLKRAALARTRPGALWEFYGSTEGQFTVCSPEDWEAHPGTVGRARAGRRIGVDDGGVIWCEAPGFARFEYWRDPDATARAWRDGAFTVGDVGHLDDEGFLFLDGRRDDLVITGGVNVYPAEVEAVLADVPGVAEVAVFGVDDPQWGERVCAAVVGHVDVDVDALSSHARAHLAPYKRPKQYFALDELPRTATGKLRRRDLPDALGLATDETSA